MHIMTCHTYELCTITHQEAKIFFLVVIILSHTQVLYTLTNDHIWRKYLSTAAIDIENVGGCVKGTCRLVCLSYSGCN